MTYLFNFQYLCRCCRKQFSYSAIRLKKVVADPELKNTNFFAPRNIKQYFYTRHVDDYILSKIPEPYAKINVMAENFVLADPQIAKSAAFTICSQLKGGYILEFDPGLGFMSEILITASPHLWLFEKNYELIKLLHEKFADQIGKKVKIVNITFKQLRRIISGVDGEVVKNINDIFVDLPRKPWNDDISLSFIITAFNKKIIKFLLYNLTMEEELKQFGKPEFFLFVDETLCQFIMARPDNEHANYYRNLPILFQIFFQVDIILKKLPRKAFLPWPNITKNKNTVNHVFLVRVTPKTEMFLDCRGKSFREMLFIFVKTFCRPKQRIISALERFVPNCGPQFILEDNITTYTNFLELQDRKSVV